MEVSTIQIAKYRLLEPLGIELIDTTVKSGIPAFAPTWDMVMGHKAGKISDAEYTKTFREKMARSIMTNTVVWNAVSNKEKIALACYCQPDRFCHRHLLVKIFECYCRERNIPYLYRGEIA